MVMTAQPLKDAICDVKKDNKDAKVIYLSPAGTKLDHKKATALAKEKGLILICGHYEGLDQRIIDEYVDEEISIGDYVLTNGTLAAVVVMDAVVRLLPGVLGAADGTLSDSFCGNCLEYPQYTRPAAFCGLRVPEVLLSGNHREIARWRAEVSRRRTFERRPDMLAAAAAADRHS